MKHLLLLGILACCLQSAYAQSKMPVRKHHKKHHAAHRTTARTRTQHNIKIGDGNENDYHNTYEGKASRSNDGVKKNNQRNLNYNNTNANLAPSNGGNTK